MDEPSSAASDRPPEGTLDALAPGSHAVIVRVDREQPGLKRLLEMGLVEGTKVHFLRTAPLGDPMEIELRGYRLSIRKQDAAHIHVRPA